MSSLRQPLISGIVDRSRSVKRGLYTFTRNIPTHCNQLDLILATVEVGQILQYLCLTTQC